MSDIREQYLGTDRGNGSGAQRPGEMMPTRELPQAIEMEEALLGSMMIGGEAVVVEVRAKLNADAFVDARHQTVFTYLLAAVDSKMAIDVRTFTQALTDSNVLDEAGGVAFVTHLFVMVPTAINFEWYLASVREKWILRTIIAQCTRTVRRAYEDQDEVEKLLNEHVENVIEIGQMATAVESIKHIKDYVPEAVKEIEAAFNSRGEPIGLPSGFIDLDRMTGGFQAPLTYYFAGRPAMGKSSVMVEVAEHIAVANVANGNNVGIFSIEMTGRQIVKRMICSMIDLNLQRLRDGFKAKDTLSKVNAAAAELVKSHVWINDRNLSITDFRYLARRMVTKMKCRLIIIDYIQRMHSTSRRAQGNREQEMNEIAQGISATAKELNIPIIVLAQLNRKNEDRADKVPALSDLRESGSMEQEARFVGLLHRPVYYVPGEDRTEKQKQDGVPIPQGRLKKLRIAARIAGLTSPDPDDNGEIDQKWVDPNNPEGTDWVTRFEEFAQLIVAKQNEGPVGTVNLRFVKQYARFENITKRLYSNNPSQRQQ